MEHLIELGALIVGLILGYSFTKNKKTPERKPYTIYFENGEYLDVENIVIDNYLNHQPDGTTINSEKENIRIADENGLQYQFNVNQIVFIERNW